MCLDYTDLIPVPVRIPRFGKKYIKKAISKPNCSCGKKNSFTDTPVHAQDAEGNPKLVVISELKIGDKVLAKSEWKAQGEELSYESITDIMSTLNSEHKRELMIPRRA